MTNCTATPEERDKTISVIVMQAPAMRACLLLLGFVGACLAAAPTEETRFVVVSDQLFIQYLPTIKSCISSYNTPSRAGHVKLMVLQCNSRL